MNLSAGEAAGKTDDTSNARADLTGTDPFATATPTTKAAVEEEPVKATATTRDLLLGSSFRLPLNPDRSHSARSSLPTVNNAADTSTGNSAANDLNSAAADNRPSGSAAHDGRGGASGSVTSATTASGGGGGGWIVWGEAVLTNFDDTDGDLVLDGEV